MVFIPVAELGPLWVGDVPYQATVIEFVTETGAPATLEEFATYTIKLRNAVGTVMHTQNGSVIDDFLVFNWHTSSYLTTPGIYLLDIVLKNTGGVHVTAEPFRFVVEIADGWLKMDEARSLWADAPVNDVYLFQLLDSAKTQCATYAPTLGLTDIVPNNYKQAQLMQVRAVYMSFISNQNDSVGVDGYQVRTFPLDWNIKALLRPKSGRPVMS
jgi:hypothetical protein